MKLDQLQKTVHPDYKEFIMIKYNTIFYALLFVATSAYASEQKEKANMCQKLKKLYDKLGALDKKKATSIVGVYPADFTYNSRYDRAQQDLLKIMTNLKCPTK